MLKIKSLELVSLTRSDSVLQFEDHYSEVYSQIRRAVAVESPELGDSPNRITDGLSITREKSL